MFEREVGVPLQIGLPERNGILVFTNDPIVMVPKIFWLRVLTNNGEHLSPVRMNSISSYFEPLLHASKELHALP